MVLFYCQNYELLLLCTVVWQPFINQVFCDVWAQAIYLLNFDLFTETQSFNFLQSLLQLFTSLQFHYVQVPFHFN